MNSARYIQNPTAVAVRHVAALDFGDALHVEDSLVEIPAGLAQNNNLL